MIHVYLASAIICFQNVCHPVLVGANTPTGIFQLHERLTQSDGYGGNVIQFLETKDKVYAIHRTWMLNKSQHRDARIVNQDPKERIITAGCINVQPEVFDEILNCCVQENLQISP